MKNVTPFNMKNTSVTVFGLTEEMFKIYESDKKKHWDLIHPFMYGGVFVDCDDYNEKLKKYCDNSNKLGGYGQHYLIYRDPKDSDYMYYSVNLGQWVRG